MARSVMKRSQGYRPHKMMHPSRDWFIGIVLLIAVVGVGGALNAREYAAYNSLETQTNGDVVSIKKYSYSMAQNARTLYEDRAQAFGSLNKRSASVSMETSTAIENDVATSSVATTTRPVDEVLIEMEPEVTATTSEELIGNEIPSLAE